MSEEQLLTRSLSNSPHLNNEANYCLSKPSCKAKRQIYLVQNPKLLIVIKRQKPQGQLFFVFFFGHVDICQKKKKKLPSQLSVGPVQCGLCPRIAVDYYSKSQTNPQSLGLIRTEELSEYLRLCVVWRATQASRRLVQLSLNKISERWRWRWRCSPQGLLR